MRFINFYFRKLIYSDEYFCGEFSAPDLDVYCEFKFHRQTEQCDIWDNNKPIEDIVPLPIWWLNKKLEQNGKLNENECKISY